jgi:hypothetical protein
MVIDIAEIVLTVMFDIHNTNWLRNTIRQERFDQLNW